MSWHILRLGPIKIWAWDVKINWQEKRGHEKAAQNVSIWISREIKVTTTNHRCLSENLSRWSRHAGNRCRWPFEIVASKNVNTISQDTPTFEYKVRKTANHISQCAIISIERCRESNIVLHYYFPWLSEVDLCDIPLKQKGEQAVKKCKGTCRKRIWRNSAPQRDRRHSLSRWACITRRTTEDSTWQQPEREVDLRSAEWIWGLYWTLDALNIFICCEGNQRYRQSALRGDPAEMIESVVANPWGAASLNRQYVLFEARAHHAVRWCCGFIVVRLITPYGGDSI